MNKVCNGRLKMKGCGEEKTLAEFDKTKGYIENICRDCKGIHRREVYREKTAINKILNGAW